MNGNRFERNFRKLSHSHPELRRFSSEFESRLEEIALRSLSSLFPQPRYSTLSQLLIPGVTDVDLLVLECDSGFVLVVQHKWLIGPDRLQETIANDEKLADGVSQAVRSRHYLRSNVLFLRQRLNTRKDQIVGPVESVVVSRGLEGTGFLGATEVPIITEIDFRELVSSSNGLAILWQKLNSRPDQKESEARSAEISSRVRLCGYQFVIPGLAVKVSRG